METRRLYAALSFEDRATCGAKELIEQVDQIVMVDYGSRATPGPIARAARELCWERTVGLCKRHSVQLDRLPLNPYSMRDLEDAIVRDGSDDGHTYVDITCLTRPHVIAAARAAVEMRSAGRPWSIAYTTPLSYGDLASASEAFGWSDTLVLPIGREPSASNEGVSLGIVLLGQEAERLQIALDEVEPAAGFAVYVVRDDRPDLYRRTLSSNKLVLQHLRSLRMPGRRADAIRPMFPSLGWVERELSLSSLLPQLGDVVRTTTEAARAAGAPIFLYPFGPKLSGFAAAFMLATSYPEASWSIYPIAATHPIDYSEGCASVAVVPGEEFLVRER